MSKVKYYLSVIVVLLAFSRDNLLSQSLNSITKPILWKKFSTSSDYVNFGNDLFNFNSYEYFDGMNDQWDIKVKPLEKISMFVVFSSLNGGEVFKLKNIENDVFVLNDSNLISNKIMPYSETFKKPKILSYHDYLNNVKLDSKLSILINDSKNDIKSFKGGISELIIFDKIISKKDRSKIDSYLSIKYGIPLTDTSVYVSSSGETLWDCKFHAPFQHNVAAIYRDDNLKLIQKQSKNCYSNFPIALGLGKLCDHNDLNPKELSNFESIFWADNNGDLNFDKTDDNTTLFNTKSKIGLDLVEIKERKIHFKMDFSGTSNFDPKLSTSIKFGTEASLGSDSKGKIIKLVHVKDYVYEVYVDIKDIVEGSYSYFSIQQSPKIILDCFSSNLDCSAGKGSLNLRFNKRNLSDCSILVNNANGLLIYESNNFINSCVINDLTFGNYMIQILNEESLIDFQEYELSEKDCKESKSTTVFPNPIISGGEVKISSGDFSFEDVKMSIFNTEGKLVYSNNIIVNEFLEISYTFRKPGLYNIKLFNGTKERVLNVIVLE